MSDYTLLDELKRVEAENAVLSERVKYLEAELADPDDPYCPVCGSCGIVDCCGELRCKYVDVHHKEISENNKWLNKLLDEAQARVAHLEAGLQKLAGGDVSKYPSKDYDLGYSAGLFFAHQYVKDKVKEVLGETTEEWLERKIAAAKAPLRRALILSVRAAGGLAADQVSDEFLCQLPDEITALSAQLAETKIQLDAEIEAHEAHTKDMDLERTRSFRNAYIGEQQKNDALYDQIDELKRQLAAKESERVSNPA